MSDIQETGSQTTTANRVSVHFPDLICFDVVLKTSQQCNYLNIYRWQGTCVRSQHQDAVPGTRWTAVTHKIPHPQRDTNLDACVGGSLHSFQQLVIPRVEGHCERTVYDMTCKHNNNTTHWIMSLSVQNQDISSIGVFKARYPSLSHRPVNVSTILTSLGNIQLCCNYCMKTSVVVLFIYTVN